MPGAAAELCLETRVAVAGPAGAAEALALALPAAGVVT